MERKEKIIDIVSTIQSDDIGYAIESYYGKDLNSESPELNGLWEDAYKAIQKIREYLSDYEDEIFEDI